jgi:hypothetical protein
LALAGLVIGAVSLSFNPFFAVSVVAVGLSIAGLRAAAPVTHPISRGVLRILGIIGIMGALAGVSVAIHLRIGA